MNDLHNLVAAGKVLILVPHIVRSNVAGAPPTSTHTHAPSAAAVQGDLEPARMSQPKGEGLRAHDG